LRKTREDYGEFDSRLSVTHEKCLLDRDAEFTEFIPTMDLLGPQKLGPVLLQFPFFGTDAFQSRDDFLARLVPFLKKLPRDH